MIQNIFLYIFYILFSALSNLYMVLTFHMHP